MAIQGQGTGTPDVDDLMLVDCRLPPRQKRIGNSTRLVASRPIRTTAVDCRIRGGGYTAYDRANYQTSLKIWLAEAQKGTHDAEYYVGKIYEGGLGTEPDYEAAAAWYERAANGGHSASQFSLARLYEKGLGVPADPTKALNLYRKASGLSGDYAIVESGRYEALEQAAYDLALREQEIEELQRQLDEATQQQKQDQKHQRDLQQQLDDQKRKADTQRTELGFRRTAVKNAAAAVSTKPAGSPARVNLGRYYAVVIGNAQYENWPAVPSAEHDARAMQALLHDAYGFEVTLLINAKRAKILSVLYAFSQTLGENDNLIVFYAGHGKRDLRNRHGWWLPADAARDDDARTNWLPNQEVSDRLALAAARHILVLADASYVGDITRGAPLPAPSNMSAAQWTKYIDAVKKRRGRLALSSGADEPLPGSGGSSRFTATLIEVLRRQQGVVPASRIHREVVDALTSGTATSAVPTFAPLQSAFHEGVDFLFERKP
jgi:hypothetical protein